MKGHWQKDVPKQSGEYWTATRDGLLAGTKIVSYGKDGALNFAGFSLDGRLPPEEDGWQGWWWSEPVEKPPRPPRWEP